MNLKPTAFALIVIGGPLLATLLPNKASAQTNSLYERLGGKESITMIVDELAVGVLADPRINQKFAQSDAVRLKTQLIAQLCAATGGPCQYTGRDMKTTHARMGVTIGEFNALMENFTAILDKFNVSPAEQKELLGALMPLKNDIVESESTATGTPLPKKFKPYSTAAKHKTKSEKRKHSDETLKDQSDETSGKQHKKKKKEASAKL